MPKDDIIMLSDTKTKFSEKYGWPAGMGDRNGRWAMIIEKDGSISYAENEKSPREVTVSAFTSVSDLDSMLMLARSPARTPFFLACRVRTSRNSTRMQLHGSELRSEKASRTLIRSDPTIS